MSAYAVKWRLSVRQVVGRCIVASSLTLLVASCGTSRVTVVPRAHPQRDDRPLNARPATGPEFAALVASAKAREVGGFNPAIDRLAFVFVTNNGWATASIVRTEGGDVERERPGASGNRAIIFRRTKGRWQIVAFGSSYLSGAAFRKVGIPGRVLEALKLES
jgi:hypothetical protein